MAKIKEDIDDLHESSLDNSADGEYILSDEAGGTFGNSVTYKLIHVGAEEPDVNMQNSPAHDTTYYVISNPGDVFGTQAVAPKKSLNPKHSAVKVEPIQNKAPPPLSKKRDDKRRATHNEVERRRRDKINCWIMKLANLIPNSGLPDSASKGGILAKACDHITDLTERQKRLEKLEVENEKLVLEVLRLNQELSDLRKDNSSMRNQLADNCIVHNTKQKGQKP